MSDDEFWGGTNPADVSIDTVNSDKMMARSHIAEQHTQEYQRPVPPELSNSELPVRFPKQIQGFEHFTENKQCNTYNKYKYLKSRKPILLQST